MTTPEPARRPGGRSARVRTDVHTATRALLAGDRWAQLTLGGIAERAGVQPSTLYRRWGDLGVLLAEVLDARLAETSPLPDTGTLAGDLHRWGAGIASDLDGPEGQVLLRGSLLLSGEHDGDRTPDQVRRGRLDEIEALLSRARTRGEPVPTARDVFELLIGPLYGYALFGRGALVRRAPALVDRLLDHTGRSSMTHTTPRNRAELLAAVEAGSRFDYLPFYGQDADPDVPAGPWVLSQWWPATFTVDGVTYRTAEQYMMERKADLFGDTGTAARILADDSPAVAKRLGREVAGFDSAAWKRHRSEIVVRGNGAKFGQDEVLAGYLRSTADAVIVEASPDDRVWGVGRAVEDPAATDPHRWDGENLLGFALMQVRDGLRR